jgi:glycerol uptake facilitator-like aquaporin
MLKKIIAEFIGTSFLLMVIVGSGIMGELLTNDQGLILLANSLATGAGLIALIWIFEPISGAHFNPAVSLLMFLNRKINLKELLIYTISQITGGILGVLLANLMFDLPAIEISDKLRDGSNIYLSEFIATFGLLLLILIISIKNHRVIAPSVGLYITAGYWFTSSTSFANPAVSIARSFTNTFTGICPNNVAYFIAMQITATIIVFFIGKILLKD